MCTVTRFIWRSEPAGPVLRSGPVWFGSTRPQLRIQASVLRAAPPVSRGPPAGRGAWLRPAAPLWRRTSFCFFTPAPRRLLPLLFLLFFFSPPSVPLLFKGKGLARTPASCRLSVGRQIFTPRSPNPARMVGLDGPVRTAELLLKWSRAEMKRGFYPASFLKVTTRASATAGSKRRRIMTSTGSSARQTPFKKRLFLIVFLCRAVFMWKQLFNLCPTLTAVIRLELN